MVMVVMTTTVVVMVKVGIGRVVVEAKAEEQSLRCAETSEEP